MWQESFKNELTKNADLISKSLFKKMDSYDQEKIVGARDTISKAVSDTKIPRNVREKMIEAAFDSLKNMSWVFVNANSRDGATLDVPATSSKPKKKYVL